MPTMQDIDHVTRAAAMSLCIGLALGGAPALAHGTSGGLHAGASFQAPRTAPAAPMASPALGTHATSATPSTTVSSPAVLSPLPASVVQGCEGAVEVNCLATAESRVGASGGDTNPLWSAPVPTTLPPAPTSQPIAETAHTSLPPEQSGGASGVVITAGGGPTLADCMALWEPAVHMTRSLWKSVCIRTMNGIDEPSIAIHAVDPTAPAHTRPTIKRGANG